MLSLSLGATSSANDGHQLEDVPEDMSDISSPEVSEYRDMLACNAGTPDLQGEG